MSKIEPAIPPEEWSTAGRPPHGAYVGFTVEDDRTWHRVAAVALHGQSFGFTREDAEKLGIMRLYLMAGASMAGSGAPPSRYAIWLDSLADRIAALLPPVEGK